MSNDAAAAGGDHLHLDDVRVRHHSFEARAILTGTGQVLEVDHHMARLLRRPAARVVGTAFVDHVAAPDRGTFEQALALHDPHRRWRFRLRQARDPVVAKLVRPSAEHDDALVAVVSGDDIADLRGRVEDLVHTVTLQRAVIDSLEEILVAQPRGMAGLAVAVRHAPFDLATTTSGDAADVLPIDEHRCHVALMDVTGHGITHTAQALLLVQTLRVLALEDTPVDALLRAALPLVRAQDADITAAGVVGRYDVRTGVFQMTGAGAPPVTVARADGAVETVDLAGSPLGFDVGPDPRMAQVTLAEGDRLVLVTDGVLGRDLRDWRARISHACTSPPGPQLDDLVAAVLHSGLPGPRRDDATVLALERTAPDRRAAGPPDEVELHLRWPDVDVAPVRMAVRRWLRSHDVPAHRVGDTILVLSELCTNAVQAARTGVTVRAAVEPGAVRVEVHDDGTGLPLVARGRLADSHGAPDRTRGLFIVGRVADQVTVETDETGTVIRAWCR